MKPAVIIGYSTCWKTREAFLAAGCEAYTCDLLPAREDDPDSSRHLQGDIWSALGGSSWAFGVFHPMCTYLTVSAAWALKDPDFTRYPGVGYHQRPAPGTRVGAARRAAQAAAIANFQRLMDLPFPAVIENPAQNFVSAHVGRPAQVVQPYEYGDDASKATGLWFNAAARAARLPLLEPTHRVAPRIVGGKPRWANQTDSGQNNLTPSTDRWLLRSATFPGIALALGTQYGAFLTGAHSCSPKPAPSSPA